MYCLFVVIMATAAVLYPSVDPTIENFDILLSESQNPGPGSYCSRIIPVGSEQEQQYSPILFLGVLQHLYLD
jgi:hypothetical protein